MLTQKQAFAKCRKLGFTVRKTPGGDYRLCPKGQTEKVAYYTANLNDLVDTAENWNAKNTTERVAPLEHRFDEMHHRDDYEMAIFLNADHFTTFRRHGGRHPRDTRRFDTFPQAVADANKGGRVILYAVTKTERSACIDEQDWGKFMKIWEERDEKRKEM